MKTVAAPGNNKHDHMSETNATIAKGAFGLSSVGAGTIASFLPQLEAWLRVGSLCVGIVVGLVTIYSILKKRKS